MIKSAISIVGRQATPTQCLLPVAALPVTMPVTMVATWHTALRLLIVGLFAPGIDLLGRELSVTIGVE